MDIRVHTCTYTDTHAHIHTYMGIHVHMYTNRQTDMHTQMHTCMHTHICLHICMDIPLLLTNPSQNAQTCIIVNKSAVFANFESLVNYSLAYFFVILYDIILKYYFSKQKRI